MFREMMRKKQSLSQDKIIEILKTEKKRSLVSFGRQRILY